MTMQCYKNCYSSIIFSISSTGEFFYCHEHRKHRIIKHQFSRSSVGNIKT